MFGVVPRPLWETRVAPDERHRIPLAMRCLLVEHPDGLVLIDTALGNKEDAKFLDIYGVENAGLEGATQLEDALASAGFLPADVRWVINTHLHFDHAGGNTTLDPELENDPRRHVRPDLSPTPPTSSSGASSSSPATPTSGPGRAICRTTSSRSRRRTAGGCSRATVKCCPGSRCG